MVRALKVVRYDFDNMKNTDPVSKSDLGMFVEDENGTAHHKVLKLLQEVGRVQLYLGWDQRVYPRFEVTPVVLQ